MSLKPTKRPRSITDLHPQGYLYNLIYWLSIFHQDLAGMLASIMRMNYFFIHYAWALFFDLIVSSIGIP